MSLYNERIDVRSTTAGQPALFAWRGHMYRVRRVIGRWNSQSEGGDNTPDRPDFCLVRVAAESDGGQANIADLTLDTATNHWIVRRFW
ncbi:DUF6504 family protein [Salinactinospora qingdaonensis]|uniref:DUF6504 domain-containing protein n=1 Tax=Salinactinospora qingdaonensis TaxID=702744 RepID=A0ABP7F828_9ACTN